MSSTVFHLLYTPTLKPQSFLYSTLAPPLFTYFVKGVNLAEAKKINTSLLTLRKCIEALSKGASGALCCGGGCGGTRVMGFISLYTAMWCGVL